MTRVDRGFQLANAASYLGDGLKKRGENPLQSPLLPSSVIIIFNIIPIEFIGGTVWENDFTSGSFINF